ncbi:hypothetical protein J479_2637 [Acinetobacter baumannii 1297]|nr:hypothetical protein J479_2637 [Acinetobacter baumannii 1297]
MIITGSIHISFKDECNCTGCFYTRVHGGYMPCQRNRKNKAINGQPIQPPKKP